MIREHRGSLKVEERLDGAVWVLRFNNGVTSAGVLYDGERRPPDDCGPGLAE